jgi:hypothetical protein
MDETRRQLDLVILLLLVICLELMGFWDWLLQKLG